MKLIGYLSNGYPSMDKSREIANCYANSGCDILEIDFPDLNPYLENELISKRMLDALKQCSDYEQYMKNIMDIKKENPKANIIIVVYESTVKAIGKEKFADFLTENNLLDLIFVGLQSDEIKDYLIERGIKISCYIQFHLPDDDIKYALRSNGFVYLQAKPSHGVKLKYQALSDCIKYLRERKINRAIYCGVGIHGINDIEMAKEAGADAVFIGTTFLNLYDDLVALSKIIAEFKSHC